MSPTVTKLRGIRRQRGFAGCRSLSQALGLSHMCVYYWEAGKSVPRSDNAARLAAVLQTPIETLLEPDNEQESDVENTPDSGERQTQTTSMNRKSHA